MPRPRGSLGYQTQRALLQGIIHLRDGSLNHRLDANMVAAPDLHLYAHCHPSIRGAVSELAINASRHASHVLTLSGPFELYTLHAARLQGATVQLNGKTLALSTDDELPRLEPRAAPAGTIRLAPETITFLVFPEAANPSCR